MKTGTSSTEFLIEYEIMATSLDFGFMSRYFGITGKGVANLLIALPKLSLLMCEPYLLREAIKFVHTGN